MLRDGQTQYVMDVEGVEQRRSSRYSRSHGGVESQAPGTRIDVAVRLALMVRFEPIRVGGGGFANGVVVLPDGGDRRELARPPLVDAAAFILPHRPAPSARPHHTRPVPAP